MKFSVERDVLAEAVTWTARSLSPRPPVPVLSGLLIKAENGALSIASFDYEPPERPADCQVENWGGVVVADSEGAGFSCAEAPAPAAAEPLAYGESISAHGMTCTSERDGMSCTSDTTGRGFSLARAGADFTN